MNGGSVQPFIAYVKHAMQIWANNDQNKKIPDTLIVNHILDALPPLFMFSQQLLLYSKNTKDFKLVKQTLIIAKHNFSEEQTTKMACLHATHASKTSTTKAAF